MAIESLHDMWQSGRGGSSQESNASELLGAIRRIRNTYWRRNLLTLVAFIIIIVAMGYLVGQLELQEPLSHTGITLGAVAMVFILVLKWLRQSGLAVRRFHESNLTFLKRAAGRLRYSRWVLTWGVGGYIVLFGAAFGMVFPELFAGRDTEVKLLGLAIGYGYLLLMAWQGIHRARREYDRDVAPIIRRLEESAARLKDR